MSSEEASWLFEGAARELLATLQELAARGAGEASAEGDADSAWIYVSAALGDTCKVLGARAFTALLARAAAGMEASPHSHSKEACHNQQSALIFQQTILMQSANFPCQILKSIYRLL